MNRAFAKHCVYKPIQALRGERVLKYLNELEKTQELDPEKLLELTFHKMRRIIRQAYGHVPHYRKQLESSKIRPEDIKSIGDWLCLPFLTKADIQNNGDQLLSKKASRFLLVRKTTGGSTGQAVTVYKSPQAAAYARAAMYRAYRWWGIDIGDKQARFWGIPLTYSDRVMYQIIDALMNRRRIAAFDFDETSMRRYYNMLRDWKPDYLYGYVSMLVEFANFIIKHQLDVSELNLRLVITTSEVLYPNQRRLLESAFGAPVMNEYGCGEIGTIACECRAGSMHVNAENIFLEILKVNSNEPCADGEAGEVVVTELNNHAMPLIRYRLKDLAKASKGVCQCGRGLTIISEVIGRAYDFLTSSQGRRFHGEYVMYLFEDLKKREMGVKQFQVIQSAPSIITVKIVPGENFNKSACVYLTKRFRSDLGETVKTHFEFVKEIDREESGKLRLIRSYLQSP